MRRSKGRLSVGRRSRYGRPKGRPPAPPGLPARLRLGRGGQTLPPLDRLLRSSACTGWLPSMDTKFAAKSGSGRPIAPCESPATSSSCARAWKPARSGRRAPSTASAKYPRTTCRPLDLAPMTVQGGVIGYGIGEEPSGTRLTEATPVPLTAHASDSTRSPKRPSLSRRSSRSPLSRNPTGPGRDPLRKWFLAVHLLAESKKDHVGTAARANPRRELQDRLVPLSPHPGSYGRQ